MVDLKAIGLDQYMVNMDSPLYQNVGPVVSSDTQYDNTLGAQTLSAGAVRVPLTIGVAGNGAYVRLDGTSNRIIVNDGTTNRIVIGSV